LILVHVCSALSAVSRFSFYDPPTPVLYTLSLHDALPIFQRGSRPLLTFHLDVCGLALRLGFGTYILFHPAQAGSCSIRLGDCKDERIFRQTLPPVASGYRQRHVNFFLAPGRESFGDPISLDIPNGQPEESRQSGSLDLFRDRRIAGRSIGSF